MAVVSPLSDVSSGRLRCCTASLELLSAPSPSSVSTVVTVVVVVVVLVAVWEVGFLAGAPALFSEPSDSGS